MHCKMLAKFNLSCVSTDPAPRIAPFMLISRAEAYAPASMANLGVGFDILGLALDSGGDTVCAEWSDTPGVTIASITGDGGRLPLDPSKNTAGIAALAVLRMADVDRGVSLRITKGLPLASGLGSSAASAVAGAVAVNALLGSPFQRSELLAACLEGEAAVSGYHADNVGPSLLGGILLITGVTPDSLFALPVPERLVFAIATPGVAVPTAEARAVLPQTVSLKMMVHQTAYAARVVDALHTGAIRPLAAAMEADIVVEPARKHLMPRLDACRAAAKAAGAYGLVISGAGPTLAAICDDRAVADRVRAALMAVYDEAGLTCDARVASVHGRGAHVLSTQIEG
ncbi:MAG: Homoserine kinase [Anaerolineae bacterium]|nr:Homoserine kinase [Anaerolineae bacterium]GIK27542.1 MAG: homoserine kinase [Chloroflexota bacterium]